MVGVLSCAIRTLLLLLLLLLLLRVCFSSYVLAEFFLSRQEKRATIYVCFSHLFWWQSLRLRRDVCFALQRIRGTNYTVA